MDGQNVTTAATENENRVLARASGRRRPADPVALRGPLRSADAGAIGARGGARSGGPPGGRRAPATPTNGRPKSSPCSRRSTNRASPACSWSRPQGGFIEGPKNLALALVAFELAWVDAGAATGSLAGCLALSPIHERGTPEQRDYYMSRCAPRAAGRGPQALARRVLPHRADSLRGRRDRHAGRQGARGRMEGGRGADVAGGEARPLHHQHGVRQLRDGGGGIRRSAHQGHLHGDPGGDRPRHSSTAARPRASWCTSSPPRATRFSA